MQQIIPTTMQAIDVIEPGKNSQLGWQTLAVPQPKPTQLLVRVAAIGVNRADLMQRRGLYPPPKGESEILGLEVAGTVVATGSAVDESWIGKTVFGLVPGGGYAEYAVLEADHAMIVPAGWTTAEAAATAEVFLTAWQLLFRLGNLQPGQKVLIHAGASGVGTAATQLAHEIGAEVAVTVSSADKAAACLKLGTTLAINYKEQDFAEQLKQSWPKGVNLILDSVAGEYVQREVPLLAMDGLIVIYAMMGGRYVPNFDIAPMFQKRGRLICSTLRNRDNAYKAALTQDFIKQFEPALTAGRIKPVIQQVSNWQDAEQVHQLLGTNQTIGKLVLTIS